MGGGHHSLGGEAESEETKAITKLIPIWTVGVDGVDTSKNPQGNDIHSLLNHLCFKRLSLPICLTRLGDHLLGVLRQEFTFH